MGVEIERKFLVRDPSVVAGVPGTEIRQGYLSLAPERTIRVRRIGDAAVITLKGLGEGSRDAAASPAVRTEFEYSIPVADAEVMLARLAIKPLIEKVRYRIRDGGLVWEVDVFHGANEGLVVAEVELESESQAVSIPAWVGREVTEDVRYLNANLVTFPYSSWPPD